MTTEEFMDQTAPFTKLAGTCLWAALAPFVPFVLAVFIVGDKPNIIVPSFFAAVAVSIAIGYVAAISLLLGLAQIVLSRKFSNPYHVLALSWISAYFIFSGAKFLLLIINPDAPVFATFGYAAMPILPAQHFMFGTLTFLNPSHGPVAIFIIVFEAMVALFIGITAGRFAYKLQSQPPISISIHPTQQFTYTFRYQLQNGKTAIISAAFTLPDSIDPDEAKRFILPGIQERLMNYIKSCKTMPTGDQIKVVVNAEIAKAKARQPQTDIHVNITDSYEYESPDKKDDSSTIGRRTI